MNIPPPDLPPPENLPPSSGLPIPNLPPPDGQGNERVISQLERAPMENHAAAKVAKQIEEAIAERPLLTAAALLEEVKSYPWRRGFDHLLRVGLLIVMAFAIGAKLPLAGIVLTIIAAIYLGDFLYRVVHSTLAGSDLLPDWPKLNEPVEELIKPGARIVSAFLVGHGVWLFVWLNTASHVGMNPVAQWASYLVAAAYFPFAMMMIVFQERFAACAPSVVFPAMLRCMPTAKVLLGFSMMVFVVINGLRLLPFVGDLLAASAGLVFFIMLGRMVGMIAAQHRQVLAEMQ
ncbi:MAG: hypothetical protein ACKO8Z_02855 [Prosthecobacter sp.]